jgi:hypothetical protein
MPATFDLAAHHEFVQRHGDLVTWRRGYKCACGNEPDSNRALLTCVVCNGLGIRYGPPFFIRALVTGIRHDRSLVMTGIAQPGDLVIGFSPFELQTVGALDIFMLDRAQGEPYEGDLIKRRLDQPSDVLRYAPKVMHQVSSVNPLSGVITVYPSGSYSLAGRIITWTGAAPEPGTIYGAHYFPVYEWIPYVIPMERYEQSVNLGQRVVLRKRHLVQT